MMFRIILLTFLLSFTWGCPETPVPPCTCRLIGYTSSIITCTGVDNEQDLERSLYSMRSSSIPVRTVQIFDSNVNYLPSEVMKGLKVQELFIASSTMVSLSDTDTAFVGLEDSLEKLVVSECVFFGGWRWSQLKNLRSLRQLQSIKAGPMEVDEDIKDIAHLNITKLLLTQNSISYIYDTAFATFRNMWTLSLKYNLIKELERSMFPKPAPKLFQLILSHNEILNLPEDIFTEMPSLQSINLSNNHMLTIDQNIFRPVWNNLKMLNMNDNPLRCDCRLKWLLKVSFPLNTWAKCKEPARLKGTDVKKLPPEDIWC